MVVSHFLPLPCDAGGKTRLFNLLKRISLKHEVRFVWLNDGTGGDLEISKVGLPNIDFKEVLVSGGFCKLPYYFFSLLSFGHLFVSAKIKDQIASLREEWGAVHTQFEFSQSAKFLPGSMEGEILVVHEIRHKRMAKEFLGKGLLAKIKSKLFSFIIKKEELANFSKFSTLIVVSNEDKEYLLAVFPEKKVEVIPNGVDIEICRYNPSVSDKNKGIFFVGWFGNRQNVEALKFFMDVVWDRMDKKPIVSIFGSDLPADLSKRVEVLGWKYYGYLPETELSDKVKDSALIVPLLSGGGTRLKVLEAFARGNPVVGTGIGVDGINVVNGKHVLIENGAKDLAAAINKLLSDDVLWKGLTTNARKLVEDEYNWDTIAKNGEKLYG